MDKIFDKFIQNADNIRETWQIVEFFEEEFKKFKNEVNDYENNITKEQEMLKAIRAEYLEIQDALKNAKIDLERLQEQNKNLETNIYDVDSIDNLRKNIPIRPLEKVDIRLKDGIVVKANPARDVYSKEIAEKYLISLKELRALKSKLMNSDLENAKLKNEIKDIKAERKVI
ncbi:hypothetical protein CCY99_01660 [Helicobacter sp. 16-1353]|uniref:nickel-binding protein Mua n=1 Tax=Helicobacter sp. 16-1353 TaxID=2004996 RepID=UPI000DCF4119|nr:nickel-binding protein Mua [Helicobacter sp. 16-1353]RAX54878.1 hypothetical protein CCY99_01660 [Helicobacter sp. 16-1353]